MSGADFPGMNPYLEHLKIQDDAGNVITSIEVLSPVNKRKPGVEDFITKQERLFSAEANLVEMDLLRRGQRRFREPRIQQSEYLVSILRKATQRISVWTFGIFEPLPIVSVPLKSTDEAIQLDLPVIFERCVLESGFEKMIDYAKPHH